MGIISEITAGAYSQAVRLKEECEKVIQNCHEQRLKRFDERLKSGKPFTDDELVYSRTSLCPCGHGLAYPRECGPQHYWDCSAILKGIAETGPTPQQYVKHTGQLPFAFYDVKAELGEQTTRGVFKPQVKSE